MISVVITCKNYGKYLTQCIESVRNQTYKDIEIILVDDASTDQETLGLLDKLRFDRDLRIIRRSVRVGLAVAANDGMFKTNGKYVMRLDADDWLHPECLAVLHNSLSNSLESAAAFSDFYHVPLTGPNQYWTQYDGDVPFGSCMLIEKAAFEDLEGYNEDLKYQEDYDFFNRLTSTYLVNAVHLPLWYHRQHQGQMSNAHNERMKVRSELSQKEKVLVVIPARGGSKGVPRKNLYSLAGVSLVARAIRMVKNSGVDCLIAVSTDDSEIAAIATNEGVKVINRPAELAEDDVSTIPVVKHAMEFMEKEEDWKAEIVISVQPTCPYTPPSALKEGLQKVLRESDTDCVVSVSETQKHPYRMYTMLPTPSNKLLPFFYDYSEKYLQRQDRPPAYEFTGGFYIRRRELLENWEGKNFALGRVAGVLVPQWTAVDIDTKMDIYIAEMIVKHWKEITHGDS